MHRIHYAGGELVTGDAIAEALLRYAAVLAKQRTAASVEIPVVGNDGGHITARLLLGPASQLVSEHLAGEDDLVDEDTLAMVNREISRLEPHPLVEPDTRDADATDPTSLTGEYELPEP
ncbi:hypothetical protein GE115_14130 [Agromyces sp. CFH 90414]|uniref:Uncharacterized protein n=1 Tax=Agromyces agglutinans TaxID=2662258 RepID=A0A6I2F695_9MICO|nr:hypothetical protein [Agromyces agglutinans]MRG60995.1 hypothetical protein [Agromyces agglutinans]